MRGTAGIGRLGQGALLVVLGALGALGCAREATEIDLGDSLRVSVHRATGGVGLVELTVGRASECRAAKIRLAWRGHTPTALIARRREACTV